MTLNTTLNSTNLDTLGGNVPSISGELWQFGQTHLGPIYIITYLLIVVQDYSAWCNCKCHFISIFGLVLRPWSTGSGCRVWWYTIWLYCARARRHGHCAACREGPPRAGTTKKQLLHVPSSHYKVADNKCMWWRSNSKRIYYSSSMPRQQLTHPD